MRLLVIKLAQSEYYVNNKILIIKNIRLLQCGASGRKGRGRGDKNFFTRRFVYCCGRHLLEA